MTQDQHLQAEAVERVMGHAEWLADRAPDSPYAHSNPGDPTLGDDLGRLLANLDKLATERQAADAMADAFEALALDRLTALAAAEAERDALSVKLAGLEGALRDVLARDAEWSPSGSKASCDCINLSSEAERQYEKGICPHQLARQALSDLPRSPGVESGLAAADANQQTIFTPEQKRRAIELIDPCLELQELDAARTAHRAADDNLKGARS